MNRVVHFEIHAKDMDVMQKFYEELFGWKITNMGEKFGNYRMIVTGEDTTGEQWPGINGGLTPRMHGVLPTDGAPVNAFVCTVSVADVDAMVTKAQSLGGTIALEKMDVPDVGELAYMKDPEGNLFGMLKPAPMSQQ